MTSAGHPEALHEHLLGGFDAKQREPDILPVPVLHHAIGFCKLGVAVTGAQVNDGSRAGVSAALFQTVLQIGLQHGKRQIVHRIESDILERIKRACFSGTCHAGDEYHFHYVSVVPFVAGVLSASCSTSL